MKYYNAKNGKLFEKFQNYTVMINRHNYGTFTMIWSMTLLQ